MKVRNGILGPMSPDLDIIRLLYNKMDEMLPDDAHLHCDGTLYVSVTQFDNGKNVLLNNFKSKPELLQALMCSCFIPVYCGYELPLYRGVAYVDAALSNNSPRLDKHTVTVAPFVGNSSICPENDGVVPKSFTLSNTSIGLTTQNMYSLFRVLFPGSPDIQKEFCQKGYNDALRFLRDNALIPCPDCLSCDENLSHAKCKSPEVPLPLEMANEIDEVFEKFKQNLGYKLFQYRSMKVLYYMNMPSIITAKVAYAIISTILQKVQSKAGSCVDDIWSRFLQKLKEGLYRQNDINLPSEIQEPEKQKSLSCIMENMHENLPSGDCQCTTDLRDDKTSDRSDSSKEDLTVEVQIQVPQNVKNGYPHKAYPVQSLNNICQLDYPLCESKKDIQMPEMINTRVC
ncbi:patatin-like phospholipase domain-containing protein 2 [Stegodyphus dumicola]|uniref:patatin-like phospholipase domain-containing protein 2 n=1 Tax=Stegodyphus dumicola TaxID=202533 RepID=UPI0015B20AE8|nr:patatin-like phospholipase domain-containing protein 2 [Stegodyphus dumicola]